MAPKAVRRAVDFVMTVEGVATWPVALGGWLFVWGEGPPSRWVIGMPFNVAVGLVLYGGVGFSLGRFISDSASEISRNPTRSQPSHSP